MKFMNFPTGDAASLPWVQSRATDMVTNGAGTMGDNTNFTAFNFTTIDAPTGAAGSFITKPPASTPMLDEFMLVDPNKKMLFSFKARQTGVSDTAYLYSYVSPFDAYKIAIAPKNYMFIAGTTTTLAAPLDPGNTTVTLTNAVNWYGSAGKPGSAVNTHLRTFIFWDYVDSGGKTWPPETYSRSVGWYADSWIDGALVGNVITLKVPWAGPAKAAGTVVSNGSSGGSYMYGGATNHNVPKVWTSYSASIVGLTPGGVGATFAGGWPPGVAYAKIGWLPNRVLAGTQDPTSLHAVAAVSFSDASAASVDALLAIPKTWRGLVNGVASLDAATKVPIAQLPTGTTSTTVPLGNHIHADHAASHEPGGADGMDVDGPAATGTLRSLGNSPQQAAAGNDSRFFDARTPTAHNQSADTITASATKDTFLLTERTKLTNIATAATANATDASLRDRTTHTGFQDPTTISGTAMIGGNNLSEISDMLTAHANLGLGDAAIYNFGTGVLEVAAGDHTHPVDAAAATGSLRTLGTGATQAASGNDSRFAAAVVPPGVMWMFGGVTPPFGWLICDGSSLLIATYPALSAVIRDEYGGIDGTHFYLPSFGNKFPRGNDPGAVGGVDTHLHAATLTLPEHYHNLSDNGQAAIVMVSAQPSLYQRRVAMASTAMTHMINGIPNAAGSSVPTTTAGSALRGITDGLVLPDSVIGNTDSVSNVPAFTGVNFIIKF